MRGNMGHGSRRHQTPINPQETRFIRSERSEPLIYNSWCSDTPMGGTGSFNQTNTSCKLVLLAIKTPLESLHLGIRAFFQPDVPVLQGNIPPGQFLSA